MRRDKRLGACLVLLLAAASPIAAQSTSYPPAGAPAATSNLNINPKRITFDRLGRSATVYVVNQGGASTTFDVSLVDRLMLPSGQIIPLSEAATQPNLKPLVDQLKSARAMLIATPRRVTLAGNGGQVLRVRASSPADVPPGEYRTHLTVTALPPPGAGLTAEQAAAPQPGQLSFHVDSLLSLSIPVIIRVGPIDVRADIDGAKIAIEALAPDRNLPAARTAVLSFDLVRTGANSLFGDIDVRGAKERGDKNALGAIHGIGVYPEIGRRAVRIALRRIPAAGEKIDIVFRDDDVTPGKTLATKTIVAP